MERLRQLMRYGVVGLVQNGISYLAFLGLVATGTTPVTAAGLCYILGLALAYLGNRYWAFQAKGTTHRQDLPRFLLAYGAGLIFAMVCIFVLSQWMIPQIAQILNIGCTAVFIYALLNILGFGRARPSPKARERHAD